MVSLFAFNTAFCDAEVETNRTSSQEKKSRLFRRVK